MFRKNELLFKLSLMLLVMNCLSSCVAENCEFSNLPVFPKAGGKVADELENLSISDYPYLWEWIARLNKMRKELDIYKTSD